MSHLPHLRFGPPEWGPRPGELYPPGTADPGEGEEGEGEGEDAAPGTDNIPPGAPPIRDEEDSSTTAPSGTGEAVADPSPPGMNGLEPPTTEVDVAAEQQVARRSVEDDECQECERCKFLRDGRYTIRNYGNFSPMQWAMRYQHHIIPWHMHSPETKHIQEFETEDPSARGGMRSMDGIAALPCFLAEAKLGYSRFLDNDYYSGPVRVRENEKSRRAMRGVMMQLSNHIGISRRYASHRDYITSFNHTVVWVVSNQMMWSFVWQYIRNSRAIVDASVYMIPAPREMFVDEPAIGENETED